jgi:MYXO-CTERM domain-containing protein
MVQVCRPSVVSSAAAVLIALVVPGRALAKPGAGTTTDPIVVDALPYAAKGTTVGAASAISSYSCEAGIDQSGGEVVYRFALDAPARVTAWVSGDADAVDIDIHLVDSLDIAAGVAPCASRGNAIAEAELDAGEHFAIVDTYNGEAQAGPFVFHLEAIGDAWIERPIAQGVTWRARRYLDLAGGGQVVHALAIDVTDPAVTIEAIPSTGCQTTGAIGSAAGAVAGVNGGYFNVSTCEPSSLLVHDGALVQGGNGRGAFGLSADMSPMIQHVSGDWPEAEEAHGGGPILAEGDGAYGAAQWAEQGFTNAGFNGKNPRTFAGIDASGRVLFGTVDGRRGNALGMSLDELASFAVSDDIGAMSAINLDGGGSTTMWIAGGTPNGVMNYPSDESQQEVPTHGGSRANSGGFYVFAPPFDHPPRFQTEPVTTAAAGRAYEYDADAIDLDVDDVISFSLKTAPDEMVVDAATGVISWAPEVTSPSSAEVTLVAQGGDGASTEQSFVLEVDGATGPPTSGSGGGAATGTGGADSEATGGDAAVEGGCSCRAGGTRGDGGWLAGLAAGLLMLGRRRRR